MAERRITGKRRRDYGFRSMMADDPERSQGYGNANACTAPYRTDEYGRGGYRRYAEARYEYEREREGGWVGTGGTGARRRPGGDVPVRDLERPYRAERSPAGRGYEAEQSLYAVQEQYPNDTPWGFRIPDDAAGPHAARGPRGYRRPDASIYEDVSERLMLNGELDASDIEVEVRDGEVILRGRVADRRQKRMAEHAAELVRGVRDVRNELRLAGIG
ncbi:MAG TPA: BON domain-containing protein [Dehalococcoidia bacterium]|jgi:hypothetical protein|nr:BON domain-containing protein [Dehalococcoidia bacterium]